LPKKKKKKKKKRPKGGPVFPKSGGGGLLARNTSFQGLGAKGEKRLVDFLGGPRDSPKGGGLFY